MTKARRLEISPYRIILSNQLPLIRDLWSRARWDLGKTRGHCKSRLDLLRNSQGGKAVILCNGPSLLRVNFSQLSNIFTFGLNKINLLFDLVSFRPSCIVAVNDLVVQQNYKFYNSTEIPLFLTHRATRNVRLRDNVHFIHTLRNEKFARSVSGSVNEGGTVTFVALQLAFHYGFSEVALVGCDHDFATTGPANKTVVSEGPDRSHFSPDYFAKGVAWQLPDLISSERAYVLAKGIYESSGRRVVNCSVGGKLEIFPRCSLDEFFAT